MQKKHLLLSILLGSTSLYASQPIAPALVVPRGQEKELSGATIYTFSYVKIEKDATLTIAPWQVDHQDDGVLRIHCLGDCIIEENGKVDVSGKGYLGGSADHTQGYGQGGGHGGNYCAAGGSYRTLGSAGQCKDAFSPSHWLVPVIRENTVYEDLELP